MFETKYLINANYEREQVDLITNNKFCSWCI